MIQWLVGYTLFLLGLFIVCVATVGFKTTLWGFALTHGGCALATMALWWYDELRWGKATWTENLIASPASSLAASASLYQPTLTQPDHCSAPDWLAPQTEAIDLIESYTETLTERVSAVYPLVAQEHVHRIVWTVMIELFCKRVTQAQDSTLATVLTAKISKAA